ncbi:peptidoglycan DD-metalloendopeptidase family protein [Streptomyces sp. NPDC001262]|uniref:M23 family metallopeptidase n=1 Tax=Streptomyces TaxID=1883 RepID=UPI0036BCB966
MYRGGAALCSLCVVAAPLFGSGPSAAKGAAAARVPHLGSEVFRLTQEAGRARLRYERGLRAAQEQRLQADNAAQLLRGQRIVAGALHDDAGALARAQYRTGGFAVPAGAAAAEDPFELLDIQSAETGRRTLLARMLTEADDRSRSLAAQEETSAASWRALEADAGRLGEEKRAAEDRLANARSELDGMAESAVRTGSCVPMDRSSVQGGVEDPDAGRPGAEISPSGWTRPVVSYELSAGFGGTGANWQGGHTGQDFAVPIGTPVRAVGAGTVVAAGCGGAFGMSLVVRHDNGWYSQYAHLSAVFVSPGHRVRAGEWIGLSGTTGNSTGPHLHFEIRTTPEFGSAVEPLEWLRSRGVHV